MLLSRAAVSSDTYTHFVTNLVNSMEAILDPLWRLTQS